MRPTSRSPIRWRSQLAPRAAGVVVHLARRFVAAPPARLVEPPHEVDVLAEAEILVEPADVAQRLDAAHDRGRRHVADPGAAADAGRLGAEVERAVLALVAGDAARGRPSAYAPAGRPAPTRSSAKWARSGSSQPSGSSTSASTNATSGVVTMAAPALRAAAGPRFSGQAHGRRPAIGRGEPSSTTIAPIGRRGGGVARQVAARDDDRDVGGSERAAARRAGGWRRPRSAACTSVDGGTASPRDDPVDERSAGVGDPEQLERRAADDTRPKRCTLPSSR